MSSKSKLPSIMRTVTPSQAATPSVASPASISERVESIGQRLEQRASQLDQIAMLKKYLKDIPSMIDSNVLDVGCGTGPVTRFLQRYNPKYIVGIDPSKILIKSAKNLAKDSSCIQFVNGDARSIPFDNSSFVTPCFLIFSN